MFSNLTSRKPQSKHFSFDRIWRDMWIVYKISCDVAISRNHCMQKSHEEMLQRPSAHCVSAPENCPQKRKENFLQAVLDTASSRDLW